MKEKLKQAYMQTARVFAECSTAQRLHVGAVIVKDDSIISIGYNGTPSGWSNDCEDRVYNTRFKPQPDGSWIDTDTYQVVDIEDHYPFEDQDGSRYRLTTKPEVLHAETNAIAKLAKSNNSGLGADMFVTHSPCIECAKLIFQSGIRRVYFGASYRDDAGIKFLKKCGIEVERITLDV